MLTHLPSALSNSGRSTAPATDCLAGEPLRRVFAIALIFTLLTLPIQPVAGPSVE